MRQATLWKPGHSWLESKTSFWTSSTVTPPSGGGGLRPALLETEEIVFGANHASECIAGPSEGNEASIRAFEKAGFAKWKVVRMEGAEPECVMRLEGPAS